MLATGLLPTAKKAPRKREAPSDAKAAAAGKKKKRLAAGVASILVVVAVVVNILGHG